MLGIFIRKMDFGLKLCNNNFYEWERFFLKHRDTEIDQMLKLLLEEKILIKEFEEELELSDNKLHTWCQTFLQYYDSSELDQLLKVLKNYYPRYILKIQSYLLLQ